jgi:hypothetical protein
METDNTSSLANLPVEEKLMNTVPRNKHVVSSRFGSNKRDSSNFRRSPALKDALSPDLKQHLLINDNKSRL